MKRSIEVVPHTEDANQSFCKRVSTEEAKRVSEEVTKRELNKLSGIGNNKGTPALAPQQVLYPAAARNTTFDPHYMLLQYAEKYRISCDQLCRINQQFSEVQNKLSEMKDKLYDVQSQKEHFEEMTEQYEADATQTEEQLATVNKELTRCKSRSGISIPLVIFMLLYTVFLFEMEVSHGCSSTYAQYRSYISPTSAAAPGEGAGHTSL